MLDQQSDLGSCTAIQMIVSKFVTFLSFNSFCFQGGDESI